MKFEILVTTLYDLNEDEEFYKKYYYARQQEYSLNKFLSELDMNWVKQRNLLIPDIPETIPEKFEDYFFFSTEPSATILTLRHNRYSPPIEHSHTFFELIYIYDGSCKQVIDEHTIMLKTGDICIIPPGVKHSIGVFDDDSIIFNCLLRKSTLHNIFFNFLRNSNVLSAFFLNNIYSDRGTDFIIFHTGNDQELQKAFLYMYWETVNKSLYFDQMIAFTLMLNFGILIRNYEATAEIPVLTRKSDIQRYEILQFIQENFAKITLDDVAKNFYYTPEYTSKLIKSVLGKNFTQVLQQIRIEKALILLQDTNLSVANIANQVGYDTNEHFIRVFKKRMKMTPTEYRRIGYHI